MRAFFAHLAFSLRLQFRNPLALIYGYAFPLIFLVAFGVLYRHERIPLVRHLGELLTITALGGACFGLPTSLVSERERGVWRRFRATPTPAAVLIASTVTTRYILLLSAVALQLIAIGIVSRTWPPHLILLLGAFTVVAWAFIGLGLVIATLADTVPAVQALGQCLFLPMLIIGGVAVPLESLPAWTQHFSAFLPGRHAVALLQETASGTHSGETLFLVLALGLQGLVGFLVGTKYFRWDAQRRDRTSALPGAVAILSAWIAVGLLAEVRGTVAPLANGYETTAADSRRTGAPKSWSEVRAADVAALDFRVPPDASVVSPIASDSESAEGPVPQQLDNLRALLPGWAPGREADPVLAIYHLLCVPAVVDVQQVPAERFVPLVVLAQLQATMPKESLIKLLTWIAQHSAEYSPITDISELGFPGEVGDPAIVQERVRLYALKYIARLTDRNY